MNKITQLDHYLSEYLLKLDNKLVTYFLFPFSALFHPKMILIPIMSIYLLSNKSALDAAYYGLSMVITLIFSTILKRNLKRSRPSLRGHVKKFQHFRKKQKNFSIPSGDTVQAVLFSIFLYKAYEINCVTAALITIFVAMSRVYFMCHWIGDTVFAMIVETPLALLLVHFRKPIIQFAFTTLKSLQFTQSYLPYLNYEL